MSMPAELRGRNSNHGAWLLRRIYDRLHKTNQHFMGCIVGEEGSGKSHSAIKIASTIDTSFTPDRVIFDISNLLETLRDGEHDQGNFYVLDEAGVQFGRRTWQDRGQILANQALQLVRNHNLGLIFTLPRLTELDSQAQGRLQAFYEITEKHEGEYVEGKWKWMDPDRSDTTGTIYKKYPRRRENGVVKRIKKIAFTPPPEALTEPYEERKREFQEEFYEETLEELDDSDGGDGDDEQSMQELANEIMENGLGDHVSIHGQTKQPYVDKELIRVQHGLSNRDAKAVKSIIEKEIPQDELVEEA